MELERDELCDLESHSNVVLPEEMLEEILKYLHNAQDLAHARRVCRFWCVVATPLYLAKVDDIEINFSPADRKEAMYHRDLSDKYREKQRQVPNRKLNQTEINEIHHETSMKASVREGSEDASACLVTKYCDYVESGGTVQYTNFRFVGINLIKNEAVFRFFTLCGKHVKILTVCCDGTFWFCDHPSGCCKECLDQKINNAKYLLNIASLKALMQTYAPKVAILTVDASVPAKKKDVDTTGEITSPESDSDDDSYEDIDSDSDDSDDDDLRYFMLFGDVHKSDDAYKLVKRFPPSFPLLNNIQTIRVVDGLVADLFPNMILYQAFLNCPNLTNVSNFGKKQDAFESSTYDFVRALLTNANTDNLTELFIRNLDATIINTLLIRHKNRLRLKFFKVNHLVTHMAEKSFLRFLESQSATLETIMCGLTQMKNPLWSNDKIRFPKVMPKLTHLRIGLGKEEQKHLPARPRKAVAPIDWAKQFPALKTLMLPEYTTNVAVASFFKHPDPVDPLTTVTALELPAKLSTNSMARAGFLFPNVTELAVGIQNINSLRQIWTMWPKLESLHLSVIYYDERDPMETNPKFVNLDELLTGFDKSQMEMAKDGDRDAIGEPNFPSITLLQDLRELTIFSASYRTHSRKGFIKEADWNTAMANAVSDISIYHALIKLPSLKYLDISQHLHNISPSADMEFCDYMNLFHEDNETTRNNFTIMCNYRGREEAHSMCRFDTTCKDK